MSLKPKKDKIYKVRDPVHGFVKLDAQEMDIVNSPVYQRLRRIRQLSLTEMLYPGANHTRFEHSLGVLQLASEMFDHITADEGNLDRLGIKRKDLERPRKMIRLAALLHDIGHAPFSHAGEGVMPLLPENHLRYKEGKQERYEHEDYSIAAIKWIFRDYIDKNPTCDTLGIKAEDVAALLGDESVPLTRTTIIWRELISGQMDADRADYLLRDSLHLGVNYGLYDKNRLVNCITVGPPTESSDCFLAIEDGGRHVAESLVIARYQMFSQVYFHRVRRAFDYHVEQAMKEVLKQSSCGDGLFPPPTDVKRLNDYLAFDDWDMYGAFKAGKGGEHGERILRRKPYKCTGEWDEDLSCEEKERVDRDLRQYKGYLDKGATTKWYKLDKDITIYDPKQDKVYPLSYKSELIKAMPALPTVARLFIDHDGKGAKS